MKTVIKTLNHGNIVIPQNEEKQWVAEWCNISAPESIYFDFLKKEFVGEAWKHGQMHRSLTHKEIQKRIENYVQFIWGGFGNAVAHLLSDETKEQLKELNPEIKFIGENSGDFYEFRRENLWRNYYKRGKLEIISIDCVE